MYCQILNCNYYSIEINIIIINNVNKIQIKKCIVQNNSAYIHHRRRFDYILERGSLSLAIGLCPPNHIIL